MDCSINVTADCITLDTLTVDECRHLPADHPLTPLLFDSPSASFRRPRAQLDYVTCVLINAASMYGFGYLTWCLHSPTPPLSVSPTAYLPVPILSPYAHQDGYGVVSRGSLLTDNVITTIVLTAGLTIIHGTVMQSLASRGRRPLIHPQLIGPPLSYLSVWRYSGLGWRVLCVWTQLGAPAVLLSLLFCCGLCAAVGGGMRECAVEADTALWLKAAWTVPYLICFSHCDHSALLSLLQDVRCSQT